jgi:hypothetical protein
MRLCSDTPISFSIPATSAASTAVPSTASRNRRVVDHAPGRPVRFRTGVSSPADPSGAATIPASSSAASISSLPSSCGANYPESG